MDKKMTLNEKLDFIAAMENEGYNEEVIEGLIEGLENPEEHYSSKRYTSAKEMLDDILGEEDDEDNQLLLTEDSKRSIVFSKNFERDLKDLRSNAAFDRNLLDTQLQTIADGGSLDLSRQPHKMSRESRPEYKGTLNFHHKADIVVIYRLTDDALQLERIGNHGKLKLTRNKN